MNEPKEDSPKPTIGILTARPRIRGYEDDADPPARLYVSGADVRYVVGEIAGSAGSIRRVLLVLGDMGESLAATHATAMLVRFPTIKWVLMVGLLEVFPIRPILRSMFAWAILSFPIASGWCNTTLSSRAVLTM